MKQLKKYVSISITCFLILFCYNNLWAEKESKKGLSPQQKDTHQQKEGYTENQPTLSLDYSQYDAGVVYEGDEILHTFIIKNVGTAVLNINKVSPD